VKLRGESRTVVSTGRGSGVPVKMVYTAENILMVSHIRNVLEAHGIDCLLRNQYLSGGAGEIPPMVVWPELWVTDDAQYPRAKELVDAYLTAAPREDSWTCPSCGESMEGQFMICWNCGASRPENDADS